jgi:hypothetical protein
MDILGYHLNNDFSTGFVVGVFFCGIVNMILRGMFGRRA